MVAEEAQKPAKDTRQRLLDTAKELIGRESYNALSVDEICRKAGVQKGSFYHYFPSKAYLALETMNECINETKVFYDDFFSAARPPVERFELMINHLIEKQKEISEKLGHVCGCPFVTLGSELAAQDREIGEKIVGMFEKKSMYYKSALRDLAAEKLIPEDTDIDLKANEIFSLIAGQLLLARVQNDLGPVEKNLKRAVFDLIGIKQLEKRNDLTK